MATDGQLQMAVITELGRNPSVIAARINGIANETDIMLSGAATTPRPAPGAISADHEVGIVPSTGSRA